MWFSHILCLTWPPFGVAAIASRVRGAVAAVQFDDFHKNSAKIIRQSVFGIDKEGKVSDDG